MIALVTGGAHGIGAALVRRLIGRGDDVVIADVDLDGERGSLFVRTDVRSYEGNERVVAAAVERFGGLDIAVFNAGAAGPRSFSVAGYRDAMRINLDAVVYGLAACSAVLNGSALVMSSIAGLTGSPDVCYGTAKHAQIGLVRSISQTAPGYRINALCPGLVDTRAVAAYRSELVAAGLELATPEEVAAAAETVLGDRRTGQVWSVQAGRPVELVR
ncbi:SDR family oxidoreductase [Lentzea sp. NPDC005914]|uniref:SDR family NAD(P)-dependent oxidoreductase n=1 Tax=Lentzea sp. NPDC005914 TaxID=3154572 RepID=UPI0033ECF577